MNWKVEVFIDVIYQIQFSLQVMIYIQIIASIIIVKIIEEQKSSSLWFSYVFFKAGKVEILLLIGVNDFPFWLIGW